VSISLSKPGAEFMCILLSGVTAYTTSLNHERMRS
jgi:hypothetical protein